MQKMGKTLWLALFFALVIVRLRGEGGGGDATSMKRTSLPQPNDVGKSIETSNTTSMKRIGLPQSNNVEKSNETSNNVVVNTKKKNNGGSMGGGGGAGWGWGGGGGGGNRRGGWGWGSGGGGGVFWRWGCNRQPHHQGMKRDFPEGDYRTGEFAQCMVKGRCRGMRLDCPLHCGGPCFYDCRHMCKAHCKR